jgi:hypothetical protein
MAIQLKGIDDIDGLFVMAQFAMRLRSMRQTA